MRVGDVASHQHGAFALEQVVPATEAEIKTRSKTGRWKRIDRNVFVVAGSPSTWDQRLWIKLLIAGTGAVVGSRSAATLHAARGMTRTHLDIIQPSHSVPHLKAPTSRWSNSLPTWHVTEVDGFPVTTMERTLFDLAGLTSPARLRRRWAYLPADRVERMVDDALTRGQVTVPSLTRTFESLAGRGRPGTRLMREFLDVRGDGFVVTASELEDLFIGLVTDFGLPDPTRQVQVGSDGNWIGRIDFLFETAKLVVEADGRRFHSGRIASLEDRRRDLELLAAGWQLLRVVWWQLVNDRLAVAGLLKQIHVRRDAS